jgi:hypothetical protein
MTMSSATSIPLGDTLSRGMMVIRCIGLKRPFIPVFCGPSESNGMPRSISSPLRMHSAAASRFASVMKFRVPS